MASVVIDEAAKPRNTKTPPGRSGQRDLTSLPTIVDEDGKHGVSGEDGVLGMQTMDGMDGTGALDQMDGMANVHTGNIQQDPTNAQGIKDSGSASGRPSAKSTQFSGCEANHLSFGEAGPSSLKEMDSPAPNKRTLQNRKAQKDFRVRRVSYLKDLEERVRRYEKGGPGSLQDMHRTIAQLSQENQYLRNTVTRLQEELSMQAAGSTVSSQTPSQQYPPWSPNAYPTALPNDSRPGSATPTEAVYSNASYTPYGVSPEASSRAGVPFPTASTSLPPSRLQLAPPPPSQNSPIPRMLSMGSLREIQTTGVSPIRRASADSPAPASDIPDGWAAAFSNPYLPLDTPPLETALDGVRPLWRASAPAQPPLPPTSNEYTRYFGDLEQALATVPGPLSGTYGDEDRSYGSLARLGSSMVISMPESNLSPHVMPVNQTSSLSLIPSLSLNSTLPILDMSNLQPRYSQPSPHHSHTYLPEDLDSPTRSIPVQASWLKQPEQSYSSLSQLPSRDPQQTPYQPPPQQFQYQRGTAQPLYTSQASSYRFQRTYPQQVPISHGVPPSLVGQETLQPEIYATVPEE